MMRWDRRMAQACETLLQNFSIAPDQVKMDVVNEHGVRKEYEVLQDTATDIRRVKEELEQFKTAMRRGRRGFTE